MSVHDNFIGRTKTEKVFINRPLLFSKGACSSMRCAPASHKVYPVRYRPRPVRPLAKESCLKVIKKEIDKWIPWDTFITAACWGVLAIVGILVILLK